MRAKIQSLNKKDDKAACIVGFHFDPSDQMTTGIGRLINGKDWIKSMPDSILTLDYISNSERSIIIRKTWLNIAFDFVVNGRPPKFILNSEGSAY